jgi:LAO/AO transport system kinase
LKTKHPTSYYLDGILRGDRVILGKAITLVESSLPVDRAQADELLALILPHSGKSIRIGITGVPGVGKSTFIESFGLLLMSIPKKTAVLTIDPSSQLTKGSILGDKTRMDKLSKNEYAFIRPTASGSTLGGVANKTRETILLCEAAGFEVILVETVGTGQSEIQVKKMTDFFLLLMLAGAGDELQGIKKGIMEMADAVVITKADGDNKAIATKAQAEYQHALHLLHTGDSFWKPEVRVCSAHENTGISEIWNSILQFQYQTKSNGFFDLNRAEQNKNWMYDFFQQLIQQEIEDSVLLRDAFRKMELALEKNQYTPGQAAQELMNAFKNSLKASS